MTTRAAWVLTRQFMPGTRKELQFLQASNLSFLVSPTLYRIPIRRARVTYLRASLRSWGKTSLALLKRISILSLAIPFAFLLSIVLRRAIKTSLRTEALIYLVGLGLPGRKRYSGVFCPGILIGVERSTFFPRHPVIAIVRQKCGRKNIYTLEERLI